MRSARRKMAVLVTAVAALGVTAVILPSAQSVAGPTPGTSVKNVNGGSITTTTYANGDKVSVFDGSATTTADATVNAATTSSGHSVSGEIIPAGANLTKEQILAQPNTVTMAQELTALGASSSDIASFDTSAPIAVTTTSARTSLTVTPNVTAATTPSSTPPWPPICASLSYDGGHLTSYLCDTTWIVATVNTSNGPAWYMEDRFQGSSTMVDSGINPDEVTGLRFGVAYASGNYIHEWAPDGVIPMGSCTTNTISLSYKGVGISSQKTECPASFGLYDYSPTLFTTKWNGNHSGPHTKDQPRSVHGVDGVYSPAGIVAKPSLRYTLWWE